MTQCRLIIGSTIIVSSKSEILNILIHSLQLGSKGDVKLSRSADGYLVLPSKLRVGHTNIEDLIVSLIGPKGDVHFSRSADGFLVLPSKLRVGHRNIEDLIVSLIRSSKISVKM